MLVDVTLSRSQRAGAAMTSVDAEKSLTSTSIADEGPDFGVLAETVRRIRSGRLDVRMPRAGGAAGEFTDAFNELMTLLERRNLDVLESAG